MRELVLTSQISPPGELTERPASDVVNLPVFERMLAENAPLAFRVAQGVLRNVAEAEDVAQEALLRAFRKISGLRDPHKFRSWLVRMTFRMALDRTREQRRRAQRETLWAAPEARPMDPSAEQVAASREFQVRLERALSELPDRLRLVVLLNAIEGHTIDEIASILAVPAGTVKSRLFEARRQLTRKLR